MAVRQVAHCRHEELNFNEDPFCILGCDGVWDALTDQQVGVHIRPFGGVSAIGEEDTVWIIWQAVDIVMESTSEREPGAAALRDLAFLYGSTDNISALVVDLSQTVQRL